jgi:uncharacterized membrane protein
MFPTPFFEITSLLTETVLQLSPVFIKWVDADVNTIILIQVLVKLVIAFFVVGQKEIDKITAITPQNFTHYLFVGTISFLSINLLYKSYKELPISLTLLIKSFTPIFLVVIMMIIGIDQPIYYLPIFLITFITLIHTLRPKSCHLERFKNMDKTKRHQKYKAALALIFLSLMGSVSHIMKKLKYDTYESNLIRTNIFALMFSVAYFIYNRKMPDIKLNICIKLILYTLIIGYFVNKIRSQAYASVPEIYYAVFIFTGIIISYIISEKFLKHKDPEDFKEEKK